MISVFPFVYCPGFFLALEIDLVRRNRFPFKLHFDSLRQYSSPSRAWACPNLTIDRNTTRGDRAGPLADARCFSVNPTSLEVPSEGISAHSLPALQSPHMVTGIEHVAIASPDPLRLAIWYVEHLDFVINYQPASSKTVFIRAADGSLIEIIESAPDTVPAAGMNPAGLRHLALTVADFPEVYARLKGNGVRFLSDAQTINGNSLAFFTDPDGNILHLLHRETPLPWGN